MSSAETVLDSTPSRHRPRTRWWRRRGRKQASRPTSRSRSPSLNHGSTSPKPHKCRKPSDRLSTTHNTLPTRRRRGDKQALTRIRNTTNRSPSISDNELTTTAVRPQSRYDRVGVPESPVNAPSRPRTGRLRRRRKHANMSVVAGCASPPPNSSLTPVRPHPRRFSRRQPSQSCQQPVLQSSSRIGGLQSANSCSPTSSNHSERPRTARKRLNFSGPTHAEPQPKVSLTEST